ncbi:MAG TPA: universal stress protein [Kofleriaceae bacterium]|nr:universal stress protein [Kofleriaceae bacterium]
MTTPRKQQIVIAYDYSKHSQAASDYAISNACRTLDQVLHFVVALDPRTGVTALPPEGKVDFQYAERVQTHLADLLRTTFANRQADKEVHYFVHARIGAPAEQILAVANDVSADSIIIGSHGRQGMERFLLGSVSERVVREAKCPVTVVRDKTYAEVELLNVQPIPEHEHHYVPPRRFGYSRNQSVTRPPDWPLN